MCLHISSLVVVQSRAANAAGQAGQVKPGHTGQRGVQLCGDGSWTYQGTEMPPGVKVSYIEVGLERPDFRV